MIIIIILYRHFKTTTSSFYIAREDPDGYDFLVTGETWQAFVDSYGLPVEVYSAEEYYGGSFKQFAEIKAHVNHPVDPVTWQEIFIQVGGALEFKLDYFLFSQVRTLQDEINEKLDEANILENQANGIALGVSLTTVGVILSTPMVTRLN